MSDRLALALTVVCALVAVYVVPRVLALAAVTLSHLIGA